MRILVFVMLLASLVRMDGRAPVDPVNKDSRGVALKGYDAVAYFEQGRPVKGSADYAFDWMGAKWWFASAHDRDQFAAHPDRYAPQFGGYCSWAVGHGYTADIDPEAWKIVDGKLYVNYNMSIMKKWEQYFPKFIEDGNRNWATLHR